MKITSAAFIKPRWMPLKKSMTPI
jgi:hypothetical protein